MVSDTFTLFISDGDMDVLILVLMEYGLWLYERDIFQKFQRTS